MDSPKDLLPDHWTPLLKAASCAARAHRHQLRKDGQTPYVAHPFRVCMIAQLVFGISDREILTAAVLHDTIEDTTTDRDDLIEQFGSEVAEWVAALSKDKRLPDNERESAYSQTLAESSDAVKICKLADIFDNLLDSSTANQKKVVERARYYLKALSQNLSERVRPAFDVVQRLLVEIENGSRGTKA